jgi:hypothetical protein
VPNLTVSFQGVQSKLALIMALVFTVYNFAAFFVQATIMVPRKHPNNGHHAGVWMEDEVTVIDETSNTAPRKSGLWLGQGCRGVPYLLDARSAHRSNPNTPGWVPAHGGFRAESRPVFSADDEF